MSRQVRLSFLGLDELNLSLLEIAGTPVNRNEKKENAV